MPCSHPDRNESPKKAHMVLGGGRSFPLLVSSHAVPSVQVTLSNTSQKITFSYNGDHLIGHHLSLLLYTVLALFLEQ